MGNYAFNDMKSQSYRLTYRHTYRLTYRFFLHYYVGVYNIRPNAVVPTGGALIHTT